MGKQSNTGQQNQEISFDKDARDLMMTMELSYVMTKY